MDAYPDELTVLFDGRAVGSALVFRRLARKFFGRFVPGVFFDCHRALFDLAVKLNSKTEDESGINYLAWDQWIEIVGEITRHVTFLELPVAIEEFALSEDFSLEVTFVESVTAAQVS